MATKATTASGIVLAAAYMAKMREASLGIAPDGRSTSGETSPATEKPQATKTLMAVTQDNKRITISESGLTTQTERPARRKVKIERAHDNLLAGSQSDQFIDAFE